MSPRSQFVFIGSLVAWIGEFCVGTLLTKDYGHFAFLLLFFPVFMFCAYLAVQFLKKKMPNEKWHVTASYFLFGTIGLLIEWFYIGNFSWKSPFGIQFALFSFWASLVLVPLLFQSTVRNMSSVRQFVTALFVAYFLASCIGFFVVPSLTAKYELLKLLFSFTYTALLVPFFVFLAVPSKEREV